MSRKKSLEIEVETKVLKWALDSSGWKEEDIVKKLKISPKTFSNWLSGEANPTITKLENLASLIKRPFAVFFLSEPPLEKPMPKDFRMLPNKEGEFDKKTMLAIRRARRLQRISKELSENIHTGIKPDVEIYKISDLPKNIAEKFREYFSLNEESEKRFKTAYDVYNYLRERIEDKNIFVFQISMPLEDARGFTLVDDTPSIIVVNSGDIIEARIFSLLHEFGHVLVRESGVSIPENALIVKRIDEVEKWCNDFASFLLLPENKARLIFSENKNSLTDTNTLNKLSRKFKVSKAMLLYNMSKLNFISNAQYDAVLERYKPEIFPTKEKKEKKSGFAARTADKKCIDERGQRFVSLVAGNVEKGYITHSDALDYLSIKTRNFDKVTKKAKK